VSLLPDAEHPVTPMNLAALLLPKTFYRVKPKKQNLLTNATCRRTKPENKERKTKN
jgi:hypothetical protein